MARANNVLTHKVATRYRINQGIKFLDIKKAKLNQQLYTKHLECAAQWPTCWTTIQKSINNIFQLEMETYYENLNKKLDDLQVNHKQYMQPTTSLLPTHSKPHRHHLHQRGARTTGPGCTIQHTATPEDLLDQPHHRN